jgi:predicted NBD/HSP70 family sugar kinase
MATPDEVVDAWVGKSRHWDRAVEFLAHEHDAASGYGRVREWHVVVKEAGIYCAACGAELTTRIYKCRRHTNSQAWHGETVASGRSLGEVCSLALEALQDEATQRHLSRLAENGDHRAILVFNERAKALAMAMTPRKAK